MKNFSGKVLFLDRNDINTDEIIPAKYLSEITKQALQPYLLEDIKIDGFMPRIDIQEKNVIITRTNFGCGSSREHAVWALEVNNINLVIAESFARIFRQNMFNCGMMAVELPAKTIDRIFRDFAGKETYLETNLEKNIFIMTANQHHLEVSFSISDFDRALVMSGGWVEYADSKY
ncbi:MAG: 3-isopropylmalate dehydratase small subunit [Deltaproteobacteria bacterium]|nr:3-isopropylmalate dehydratase small subunit [Deltaproteobacteria bacterium]MBW2013497.1 3-isopropylmalate dehydratase small subunit [Deltaproteobacteria bacterium]MBW2089802.1 3-isopropylmalate dehydratase small subunit [Deltaproteobacteria bacterium]OQY10343.1 MAG: 3-isopropylmalate dehydratase [Desulfobacteraceae bacterium 4572_187]